MHDDELPVKSLGQHWLYDGPTLETIADYADLRSTDTVLEIGPGLGTLTEVLLRRSARVIAIELDDRLASKLKDNIADPALQVMTADILKFDLSTVPRPYKLVANIPYYLTSKLTRLLSETEYPPSVAVLLVQKEVAERIAAAPGAMSLLSVATQFFWKVETGIIVPARLFTPPPKVDSQVVILSRRPAPLFEIDDERSFFRVVRIGFSQRRKTLLNNLASGLHLPKERALAICQEAGIDPARRPQTLQMDEWQRLYHHIPT